MEDSQFAGHEAGVPRICVWTGLGQLVGQWLGLAGPERFQFQVGVTSAQQRVGLDGGEPHRRGAGSPLLARGIELLVEIAATAVEVDGSGCGLGEGRVPGGRLQIAASLGGRGLGLAADLADCHVELCLADQAQFSVRVGRCPVRFCFILSAAEVESESSGRPAERVGLSRRLAASHSMSWKVP
jgi:hypothetical protein